VHFSTLPCLPHVPSLCPPSIVHPNNIWWGSSISHETHYVVFTDVLLLSPSQAPVFSAAHVLFLLQVKILTVLVTGTLVIITFCCRINLWGNCFLMSLKGRSWMFLHPK
jgi:hypothetical protein